MTSGRATRNPGIADDDRKRMRHLALGRLQVASSVRLELEGVVRDSIRGAHRLGATVDELTIESGLSPTIIRRVIRGGSL